jgi:hypothetical protein
MLFEGEIRVRISRGLYFDVRKRLGLILPSYLLDNGREGAAGGRLTSKGREGRN